MSTPKKGEKGALKTWRGTSRKILWRFRNEEFVNSVLKASKKRVLTA
jgi:hypothetical protein